jgi:hypothetical protein
VPDRRAQSHRPGRAGAGALRRFFEPAKGDRNHFQAVEGEIQGAGERGGEIDFVAALGKKTDPVLGNRGAAIRYEEESHCGAIIRHCPMDGDAV